MQVLTFDFHNTLANCDPWFDLEIRDLPWAVMARLHLTSDLVARDQVDAAYRALRLDVIASGNEINAFDSVERILELVQVSVSRKLVESTVDSLMRDCLSHMEPVPGAVDTVRYLHLNGVRLGVVSSAVHHQTLEWILAQLDIVDCFEEIVTSASSGYYKSTPAIYTHALHALGGEAATSVHVGDSLKLDVDTAQQAGLTAVWLNAPRREAFASTSTGTVPTMTLESMQNAGPDLLDLLERIRVPHDV